MYLLICCFVHCDKDTKGEMVLFTVSRYSMSRFICIKIGIWSEKFLTVSRVSYWVIKSDKLGVTIKWSIVDKLSCVWVTLELLWLRVS